MKLYWIRYQPAGSAPRYMLVLALGIEGGKLCCLDANALESRHKTEIKDRNDYLNKLGLQDRVAAIKKLCPGSMKHYKTINMSNLVIDKEYDIS